MPKEKITLDKFFTDPAYAEEKDFLRGVFDKFKADDEAKAKAEADKAAEEAAKNGTGKTFLQSIFDN